MFDVDKRSNTKDIQLLEKFTKMIGKTVADSFSVDQLNH